MHSTWSLFAQLPRLGSSDPVVAPAKLLPVSWVSCQQRVSCGFQGPGVPPQDSWAPCVQSYPWALESLFPLEIGLLCGCRAAAFAGTHGTPTADASWLSSRGPSITVASAQRCPCIAFSVLVWSTLGGGAWNLDISCSPSWRSHRAEDWQSVCLDSDSRWS